MLFKILLTIDPQGQMEMPDQRRSRTMCVCCSQLRVANRGGRAAARAGAARDGRARAARGGHAHALCAPHRAHAQPLRLRLLQGLRVSF